MKNMPRKEVEKIATEILTSGDIIAKHGTSITNALSILSTGFDFHRTSFVMQSSKSIESLCHYGWKENPPNDSANVIIEIPREFFMDLLDFNSEEYNNWMQSIINSKKQEDVLNSVTDFEFFEATKVGIHNVPPSFKAHIPQEFIAGAFIWCNGKIYLNLEPGESALDNLSYIPNDNYYTKMQPEEKKRFITKMRIKLGIKEIDNNQNNYK